LPELNIEDIEKLEKENKKVLLKRNVIERNLNQHPEIDKSEYDKLIKTALYNPDLIIADNNPSKPDYHHFIKSLDNDNSVVLIELSSKKNNHEIVHILKMRNKNIKKLQQKKNGN
jgi:hypothetical protein